MVSNDTQYRITQEWAAKFAERAAHIETTRSDLDPAMCQLLKNSYESMAEELRGQLLEYEGLRRRGLAVSEIRSLADLPEALLRARAASGLTQEMLAARLGIGEQHVQYYESTRYAHATLEQMQAVAKALDIMVRGHATFAATIDDPVPVG